MNKEKLCVTDKAVSKWERGLSFPDISLLEPLADTFDVTIPEHWLPLPKSTTNDCF